ncbi:retrovirus-related pol polyprotein from transposon TNT 1-94 [Tanacetum coccineum]|uniref:Retrovirus-related pol polyprotein from transposon TNT 1-94 n=1 Tax=Tanacetum coccineum TaxID=301880 RepID=A0ABQ4WKA0_9ASTR
MLEFCGNKGIKQEYSNARTPQQNGVAERMNRTLIEAARTMLADSLLPTTFWAEAVNTACYIFNRVRVTKPQNKTPYELLFGHKPMISYIRPFGCHVTILDTLSVLGKFDGKSDEGFLVGYSLNSKAYRVYNLVTKRVEVNLHVNFLEEKPNVKGTSAVINHAGTSKVNNSAGTPNTNASEEEDEAEELIIEQHLKTKYTSTPSVNTSSGLVNTGKFDASQHADPDDSDMPELEIFNMPKQGIFDVASYNEEGVVTDFNNLPIEVAVSPIPTLRIHNIYPKNQILGDPKLAVQTGSKEEPKKISEALTDESWVEAMQKELLQFKLQEVWVLVDLPAGMKVIDEEVYVSQPPGFVDHDHPKKIYKVVKALYGLHQAPTAWYATLSTYLEEHGYRRGSIDKTLFIKKNKKDIMLVQVYVDDIIFGSTKKSWCDEFETLMKGSVKIAITPMETKMVLTKDEESADVDVNPKVSHLIAVKRVFEYLKGKPNLGLWYPRESPFALCKKQTIVATSTTKAEYVAAANCYGQKLWIQNQLLDYGFNFMNTKIHIDNESTICIVKNPVFHSKTKHIEIRHHFIRDAYKKKLIQVQKIHTDNNVADLLTKAFD